MLGRVLVEIETGKEADAMDRPPACHCPQRGARHQRYAVAVASRTWRRVARHSRR
jgi:hypothetical protein